MTPEQIKAAFEEIKKLVADFQSANTKSIDEVKAGKHDALQTELVAKMNSAIDEKITAVNARLSKMESLPNPALPESGEFAERKMLELSHDAQEHLYRHCMKGSGLQRDLSKEQQEARLKEFMSNRIYRAGIEAKTLSVGVDSDGGYFVRPEMNDGVITKIFESGPMSQLADTITLASADAWESIYNDSQPTDEWVEETQTRASTSTPTLSKLRIPVHELSARPALTQKILDDAGLNVDAWLQGELAERFGRSQETAFITGTGVGKPKGIADYASGTAFNQIEQVVSGHATLVQADGLIDLQNALFEPFQRNATWLMRRATAGAVRKLKDTSNRYLWSVDMAPQGLNSFYLQETLLGRPLRFHADVAAVAANALAIFYGDFKIGYKIVKRVGIRVLRDPYSTKGQVEFYSTTRVGGGVQQFQAIKAQKIST